MEETFFLVHGSWHGGWAWEPTMWCLRERGHRAFAPTFPGAHPGASRRGITHDDYVGTVTAFIEQLDLRDIVLVSHSFGGAVISRVVPRIPSRIKRLVFHTAFVVEDGKCVYDDVPADQVAVFEAAAKASPDNTVLGLMNSVLHGMVGSPHVGGIARASANPAGAQVRGD